MPVDWHLLRYCSAPLLLVQDAEWKAGPILAAVDPTTEDADHQALNHQVLEFAKSLAISMRLRHTQ